ncbi:NAD(P)-dependent dehydrogenase (short-subunit alcohol dehydrogenase family) [Nocardia transvalensis]|uniref:NAD(P)-dependent dehydrogenase (Short-subunit alcohol dehydrogenase family) n=1 Tax=Nocardia transvalensis TaxID=37333 RepID=A0A7W9PGE3_9NOCA|nr:SDR family NAD(P)-dependent oxidoreductase [Nocardia transvalensis]MBB5915143.1 NAD(P)-dependent dehydrogenase (short-subunit alcohol dehydrogenase family) [Nocardia transvalensis]
MDVVRPAARVTRVAVDRVVNPPRLSDPKALRRAVSGKTVLVTGASYGLGEATARTLAAAGATVLLVARTADRLEELAAELNSLGGSAVAYPADLTDAAATEELAETVTERYGALDVIVTNAGKSMRRSLHLQYDRFHDFERTIGVNYLGPIRLLLGLLPPMRAAGRGHIVNISTIGVRIAPGPRWGAYQASKGAFDTWLRSVSPELRADGVTVSTAYMALLYTRMSAPTPIMRMLPGLHPGEAADIVAKAIVQRPRSLAPWWALPADVVSAALPGPVDGFMRVWARVTRDTDAATAGGAR